MSDTLEAFILEGPEREVDAWWAEKGMGIDPEINTATGTPYHPSTVRTPPKPWSTDRALSHVIEDRVEEWRDDDPSIWSRYIDNLLDVTKGPLTIAPELKDYFDKHFGSGINRGQAWFLLRATNRQRLLAASRAMGLTYEQD